MCKYAKFKSFSSQTEILYIEEMIRAKEIYCSDFKGLGDPMEGEFWYPRDVDVQQIIDAKLKWRILCFTDKVNSVSPALWYHYGDKSKGICIEFSLVNQNMEIHSIQYLPREGFKNGYDVNDNSETLAKLFLTRKEESFSFEEELRILQTEQKLPIVIDNIIIGSKMPSLLKKRLIDYCTKYKIPYEEQED
jgi:hypothetical protein